MATIISKRERERIQREMDRRVEEARGQLVDDQDLTDRLTQDIQQAENDCTERSSNRGVGVVDINYIPTNYWAHQGEFVRRMHRVGCVVTRDAHRQTWRIYFGAYHLATVTDVTIQSDIDTIVDYVCDMIHHITHDSPSYQITP